MAPWKRAVYRIATIPIVMVTGLAPFVMAVLQPLSADKALDWVVQLGLWGGLWYLGVLHRLFITVACAAMVGVFLFHLQHTFPEAKREHKMDYFGG